MILQKIISDCQTGADIAGIDAARANNFPYGGWVPKGRRTEVGPLPDKVHRTGDGYEGLSKRTEQNVVDSDGTVYLLTANYRVVRILLVSLPLNMTSLETHGYAGFLFFI